MNRFLVLAFLITFLLISCADSNSDNDEALIRAIYVNPTGAEKVQDEALELIEGSQKTIDVESYLFEDQTLATAIIGAKSRGVTVRIVCDNGNYDDDQSQYSRLEDAGIPVVHDNTSDAAHNKTMIIDSTFVWTGCTNWTYSGLFRNNNNALIIESRELALCYLEDFAQMFSGDFHDDKSSNGIETINVEGTSIEVCFGPQDSPEDFLRNKIQEADESIEIGIYSLTLNYLTNDIINAHNRGVAVKIIMDSLIVRGSDPWCSPAKYNQLVSGGVDARLDPCLYAFHHKFTIIDRNTTNPEVIVSSGNYSMSGTNYGSENFLCLSGKDIVESYSNEFDRWWAETN